MGKEMPSNLTLYLECLHKYLLLANSHSPLEVELLNPALLATCDGTHVTGTASGIDSTVEFNFEIEFIVEFVEESEEKEGMSTIVP